MLDTARSRSIADMPAQRPTAPSTPEQARGRFFNTGNAFNVRLPPVPDHLFTAEPQKALDPSTPTGLIVCDLSRELACDFPATSPFVLARYARIRAGERLETDFAASGVICYVMVGSGTTEGVGTRVDWRAGDLIILPGGEAFTHAAAAEDAVLWIVTNEPQLAFERLRPPALSNAPTKPVHFTREEIEKQITLIYEVGRDQAIAGSALIFSAEEQEATRNILPTLTVAMNTLPAGTVQRPHRHNSVAVSLIIKGDRCFSVMDGKLKDWASWATSITPPVSVHSHHNGGNEQAMFLIIQDGGLFYHARAMGFEFAEQPE